MSAFIIADNTCSDICIGKATLEFTLHKAHTIFRQILNNLYK